MTNPLLAKVRDVVLEASIAYQFQQWAMGALGCHRYFVKDHVKPQKGTRLLDLGCGPGTTASYLPAGIFYVGVDISERYVAEARRKLESEPHFALGSVVLRSDVAAVDWQQFELFDVAIALGLLHHLSDDAARSMLRTVSRILAPGGRIVCIDPVFVDNQQKLDRWLVEMDRGQHVRTPEQLKKLYPEGVLEAEVHHDLLRVTYSQIITTWCTS